MEAAVLRGRGGVFEDLCLRLPIGVVSGGGCVAREAHLAVIFKTRDQPLRVAVRQRPQQHGVNHAEDRRRGADAQRERQQGDGREAGTACQKPQAVPEILSKGAHRRERMHASFLGKAQCHQRLAPRGCSLAGLRCSLVGQVFRTANPVLRAHHHKIRTAGYALISASQVTSDMSSVRAWAISIRSKGSL